MLDVGVVDEAYRTGYDENVLATLGVMRAMGCAVVSFVAQRHRLAVDLIAYIAGEYRW